MAELEDSPADALKWTLLPACCFVWLRLCRVVEGDRDRGRSAEITFAHMALEGLNPQRSACSLRDQIGGF